MSKQPVKDFIAEVESSKDPIENPIPDIKSYFSILDQSMPRMTGPKAYSLTGIIRD